MKGFLKENWFKLALLVALFFLILLLKDGINIDIHHTGDIGDGGLPRLR